MEVLIPGVIHGLDRDLISFNNNNNNIDSY